MKPSEYRAAIQKLLQEAGFYHGEIDSDFGPKSHKAFHDLDLALDFPLEPGVHAVKASSFADPVDIRGFQRCKNRGGTDNQCFKEGDNGIGLWGDDTTVDVPMCALPREDWASLPSPRGQKVLVTVIDANGMPTDATVVCELRDTMPARRFLGKAGIDLNPGAQRALGLVPPVMQSVTWQFIT